MDAASALGGLPAPGPSSTKFATGEWSSRSIRMLQRLDRARIVHCVQRGDLAGQPPGRGGRQVGGRSLRLAAAWLEV